MRLPLVFNAKAGTIAKDAESLLARLPAELRDRIQSQPLGPPWDLTPFIEQAQRAGGPLLVWGGDGTIHHAGRALVQAGCPVPLAAIPGGSGNGLVRGLRTPLDPAGAILRLIQGRELRMDLPRLDGEPFLNLCGTGFEAAVAHGFEAMKGRGFRSYARLCLGLWRSHPELALRWEAELDAQPAADHGWARLKAAWRGRDPELPERAWSLCFANLPQYGSGLWIAPGADPLDGALQWVRLNRPRLHHFLFGVPELFREYGHTHLREEGRLRRAIVQLDAPHPWQMDGEPVAARDRAELTVEPAAFRMQVTNDCPW